MGVRRGVHKSHRVSILPLQRPLVLPLLIEALGEGCRSWRALSQKWPSNGSDKVCDHNHNSFYSQPNLRKWLVVFGGFHDNLRDSKYFNDAYAFDLENRAWSKLSTSGSEPSPR